YGAPPWPPPQSVTDALGITGSAGIEPTALDNDRTYGHMFALAYQAFSKNLAHVIAFRVDGVGGGTWDSHRNNYDFQVANGNLLWPALGKLVALMKATPSPIVAGKSLFDTTIIWVQSEMGRTPGRDVPNEDGSPSDGCGHWGSSACATFLG